MLIRPEAAGDAGVIRAVTAAAFARPGEATPPAEATLVDELRASADWLPGLSLVAVDPEDGITGHVLCTRGRVGSSPVLAQSVPVLAQSFPVLALGPLSVRPDRQRRGVGSALMHAVLGAADALGEPLVGLLGDPVYYARFGFQLSTDYQIAAQRPEWQPHFQVRVLTGYQPSIRGTFIYPEPFDRT